MLTTPLQTCRCISSDHGHAVPCPRPGTESDGQCKPCYDAAANEFGQTASSLKISDLFKAYPVSNVASPLFASGNVVEFAGGFLSYPDQEKVRSLEDEIRGIRDNLSNLTRSLQQERATSAEHKHREEELTAILDELTKKQQLAFLLDRVSPDAAHVLLDSESLRNEFLTPEARPLFAMSVDIRRSTDLMLKARTPQAFAAFITILCKDLTDVVRSYHGVVDKFTGDGILCFFPEFFLWPRRWLLRAGRCGCVPQHVREALPYSPQFIPVGS